jgi:uncharacterized membrane protein
MYKVQCFLRICFALCVATRVAGRRYPLVVSFPFACLPQSLYFFFSFYLQSSLRRRLAAPNRSVGIYIGVMAIGSFEKRLDGERRKMEWEDLKILLAEFKGDIKALVIMHRRDLGG